MMEARALVNTLEKEFGDEHEPAKIAVMIRVKRVFNISPLQECFSASMSVVTCWLAEGHAEDDAVSDDFAKQHEGDYVFDCDPEMAQAKYKPKWRPTVAMRKLKSGASSLEGEGSEDFFQRSYVDGRTLITWEADKICTIGTNFDLRSYPVDVQALDVLL